MKMEIDFKRIFLLIFLLIIVPAVFFIFGWVGHVIFEERTDIKIAPTNRIQMNDITWTNNDGVCIQINNPSMATGIGGSMLPTLGNHSNIIEVKIKNENDVHMGDIVEYYSPEINDYILHRVF